MRLFNLTKNRVAVENLTIAESYSERTRGLLGRRNLDENEGLLIKKCNWIHMFFMKFPIDAVFLKTQRTQRKNTEDTDVIASETKQSQEIYKVVKVLENIKPWRLSPPVFRADSVLEIKSETSKNIILVGDELKVMEGK